MPAKDKRIDAYIAKSDDFAKPILKHLRTVVHQACPEVGETMKWSFPHFMHHGILCSMAAFKAHCSFGLWKAALIIGPEDGGPKEGKDAMGHFGRITSLTDLPSDAVLLGYLKKGMALNETGVPVPNRTRPKVQKELVVPDYFTAALRKNKKALTIFEAYSYSHKKEYVEWIIEAKRDETREKRMAQTIAWLAEGKKRNWRYENC